jgi:predicted transcriptional regulator
MKRTHYEIFWEILTFCKQPKSFTSIINRCNLNSKIGQTHLDFLKERGLLAEVEINKNRMFKSTEQAAQFIAFFNKAYRELFDDSPEFRL